MEKQISMRDQGALLTFPCRFPVKLIGEDQAAMDELLELICNEYIAEKDLIEINRRKSSHGRYTSLTLLAVFHSQAQLDALYKRVSEDPAVIMAL